MFSIVIHRPLWGNNTGCFKLTWLGKNRNDSFGICIRFRTKLAYLMRQEPVIDSNHDQNGIVRLSSLRRHCVVCETKTKGVNSRFKKRPGWLGYEKCLRSAQWNDEIFCGYVICVGKLCFISSCQWIAYKSKCLGGQGVSFNTWETSGAFLKGDTPLTYLFS